MADRPPGGAGHRVVALETERRLRRPEGDLRAGLRDRHVMAEGASVADRSVNRRWTPQPIPMTGGAGRCGITHEPRMIRPRVGGPGIRKEEERRAARQSEDPDPPRRTGGRGGRCDRRAGAILHRIDPFDVRPDPILNLSAGRHPRNTRPRTVMPRSVQRDPIVQASITRSGIDLTSIGYSIDPSIRDHICASSISRDMTLDRRPSGT